MELDTKWLIVKTGVKLTFSIIPTIIAMDKEFENQGLIAFVTSGERTSLEQLRIIRKYAKYYKVDKEFPEILTCTVTDTTQDGEFLLYTWQKPWSRLLNLGVIINPPRPAKVLFDYYREGINKKGVTIGYSPHFYGKAYDIGSGFNHVITDELVVVKRCFELKIIGMKGYLPERKNNCVHVDCL